MFFLVRLTPFSMTWLALYLAWLAGSHITQTHWACPLCPSFSSLILNLISVKLGNCTPVSVKNKAGMYVYWMTAPSWCRRHRIHHNRTPPFTSLLLLLFASFIFPFVLYCFTSTVFSTPGTYRSLNGWLFVYFGTTVNLSIQIYYSRMHYRDFKHKLFR